MWVDEAIWGHRMYDEQTPWFILLEFLNVALSEADRGQLFEEPNGFNKIEYVTSHRLYLRNILFNYPLKKMLQIAEGEGSNSQQWVRWAEDISAVQQGISIPNFSYLKEKFESFSNFVELVKLVQSGSLEMRSNKRWTSKFVFPYCREAIFEDLDRNAKSNDRRFFARTGELLYLMLCRASNNVELKSLVQSKLLEVSDRTWASMIKALQPVTEDSKATRPIGFLPYRDHSCFNDLAKDWSSILQLNLSNIEMLPHLVRITGFHLLRYQQIAAREARADVLRSYYVAEIIAPKRTLVRELSIDYYQNNGQQTSHAVSAYLNKIKQSSAWLEAAEEPNSFDNCKDYLRKAVLWPRKDSDYDGPPNPESLFDELKTSAMRRHKQHVANIHRTYGKEIGLVSKRGTNRLRYAPDDLFLKSVVLTVVQDRMEYNTFLAHIFKQYDIVVGNTEAMQMKGIRQKDFDRKAFQINATRLEQRLARMGLLKRLSDGCAYIINPYRA